MSYARRFMNCGRVSLCGVLVVETGFGAGPYLHPTPVVHGLWPQTKPYGTSSCRPPQDTTSPSMLFPCYKMGDPSHQLEFEQHEWAKHGQCAGVRGATDYFSQICALAQTPLTVMHHTRASGARDARRFARDLELAGFAVWDTVEHNGQLELSACKSSDRWVLAPITNFSALCGSDSTTLWRVI